MWSACGLPVRWASRALRSCTMSAELVHSLYLERTSTSGIGLPFTGHKNANKGHYVTCCGNEYYHVNPSWTGCTLLTHSSARSLPTILSLCLCELMRSEQNSLTWKTHANFELRHILPRPPHFNPFLPDNEFGGQCSSAFYGERECAGT